MRWVTYHVDHIDGGGKDVNGTLFFRVSCWSSLHVRSRSSKHVYLVRHMQDLTCRKRMLSTPTGHYNASKRQT